MKPLHLLFCVHCQLSHVMGKHACFGVVGPAKTKIRPAQLQQLSRVHGNYIPKILGKAKETHRLLSGVQFPIVIYLSSLLSFTV